MELWNKEKEEKFFRESLNLTTSDKLFYRSNDLRYYAYWPKGYQGSKTTLQSRNAFIGNYTEKFAVELFQELARKRNLYAVQGVICPEIGLTLQSPADVVLSQSNERHQSANQIHAIIEVKMSIVWNWEMKGDRLICIGDFKSHQGNPGLLRSDSMLKAIGKSINIRVSSFLSSTIPIIVLGNTPIADSYVSKVDHLLRCGIIQGFWSINPSPLDNDSPNLKSSPSKGFIRIDSFSELESELIRILSTGYQFFSGMMPKQELGRLIEIADRETLPEKKAEKFLTLIQGNIHERSR